MNLLLTKLNKLLISRKEKIKGCFECFKLLLEQAFVVKKPHKSGTQSLNNLSFYFFPFISTLHFSMMKSTASLGESVR